MSAATATSSQRLLAFCKVGADIWLGQVEVGTQLEEGIVGESVRRSSLLVTFKSQMCRRRWDAANVCVRALHLLLSKRKQCFDLSQRSSSTHRKEERVAYYCCREQKFKKFKGQIWSKLSVVCSPKESLTKRKQMILRVSQIGDRN